jgi:pyruvate,water dikinase
LGVLVERGSLLSHAAIVTRELGIPSIVALPGVTRWLADGDWAEMDGSTGIVRKVTGSGRPSGWPSDSPADTNGGVVSRDR